MVYLDFIKKNSVVLFIFFTLIFIIYGQSLLGDYVFDDRGIVEHQNVLSDTNNIGRIIMHPYWEADNGLYRPTTLISYAFNIVVFGNDPFSFHLINLILYIFICFFIYLLIKKLFSQPILGFICALFFLTLPIHTEVVANITGRSELLCLFFSLLVLLEFSKEKINYYLIFLYSLLAIGSKETGITILPAVICLLYYREGKINIEIIKKYFKEISAVSLGIIFYFFLRFFSLGINKFLNIQTSLIENPLLFTDPISRMATSLKILWMYFYKSFWPINLCSDYSFNQIPINHNWLNIEVLLGLFILFFSIYLIFKYKNKKPLITLGGIIFIFSFMPISNILFPIGTIAGERLFFYPSLGWCLILGFIFYNILNSIKKEQAKIYFIVFISLIMILYSGLSLKRQRAWLTEENLFTSAKECAPNSVLSLSNFGAMHLIKGNLEKAEEELTKSMNIKPIYSKGLNNLGLVYFKQGRYDEAKKMYYLALKQEFPYPGTLENLILLFLKTNEYEKAKWWISYLYGYDEKMTNEIIENYKKENI
jgi:tetratricopeptide (TPR) repeat protein